jgi:2-C-methyl-D-erythritol 4-phosphate cytidylyltransferase
MNIAVIVSGGVGKRFGGGEVPKQYQTLLGKQVISYVIEAAKNASAIDKIIVAAHADYKDLIVNIYGLDYAESGAERNITIKNALEYIKTRYDCKKVVVLDAVRPFVTSELINRYTELLNEYQLVGTAKHITDSLCSYDFHECDRSRYYLLSSPMAFEFTHLYKHLKADSPLTEVAQQLPEDTKKYLYFDFPNNFKITYPQDLPLAEMMLKAKI